MVYSWKTYGYSVSADVVGREFEKIEEKYGEVTSENILESASDEKSPIHNVFEWDDSKAAHKYRLHQATTLICNLKVTTDEHKDLSVRAYVDVSESKKGSFINIGSAFKNPDTREMVIQRALSELEAFREKYRDLVELAAVFNEIDKLKEEK